MLKLIKFTELDLPLKLGSRNNMKLEFTPDQLAILNEAIVQLPYKVAAPLIAQINSQIQEAHNKAADAREDG